MTVVPYNIFCHCGAATQTVVSAPRLPEESGEPHPLNLWHCKSCRHTTGLACVSYMDLSSAPFLDGLRVYGATPRFTRYFCSTCGCHIFWRQGDPEDLGPGKETFAVATGTIIGRADEGEDNEGGIAGGDGGRKNDRAAAPEPQYGRHVNVTGTKDGGLSHWIPEVSGRRMEVHGGGGTAEEVRTMAPGASGSAADVLDGFCHCGNVQLRITRSNASSRLPRSNYPDLIVPYHTGSPRINKPDDEKWWLRPSQSSPALTRYLAGTCACRSCRLTSGFEIQTWAFIPRPNIYLRVGARAATDPDSTKDEYQPLDLVALATGAAEGKKTALQSYESSPGVLREFCAQCGATVFWHDKWRSDLIDVSVGLLDVPEGVRAEGWLDWWTGQVSFVDDAGNGRCGDIAKRAVGLIKSLEDGMKRRH
ncbi:Mss4-like protein [Apiospora aurea]|uniref:Mss4-like protein n=1 Tax=Apiospora aurea TaxID=335848 RepID=A0ABR1QMT4_9PEZI